MTYFEYPLVGCSNVEPPIPGGLEPGVVVKKSFYCVTFSLIWGIQTMAQSVPGIPTC